MWPAAVPEPASPGRNRTTTGSPARRGHGRRTPSADGGQTTSSRSRRRPASRSAPGRGRCRCPRSPARPRPAPHHRPTVTRVRVLQHGRCAARPGPAARPDAGVLISRETGGPEATGPNRAGSVRNVPTSARQSPPGAAASATSSRILPGSCTARGLRHGASAADIAASRPDSRTASTSSAASAGDTIPRPSSSTRHAGSTRYAPSPGKCLRRQREQGPQQSPFSLVRGTFRFLDHEPDSPPRESARLGRKSGARHSPRDHYRMESRACIK